MAQQSYFCVYNQKNWKQGLKRYLYSCVHSITIHNSQEGEAIKMSIDEWMEKTMVLYIQQNIIQP